jgi:hypothetical protein
LKPLQKPTSFSCSSSSQMSFFIFFALLRLKT